MSSFKKLRGYVKIRYFGNHYLISHTKYEFHKLNKLFGHLNKITTFYDVKRPSRHVKSVMINGPTL